MPKQIVESKNAPVTGFTDKSKPSPLAQAIRAGDFLYVSGQGPLDPATREVVAGDISAQTRRVLENLRNVLEAAGATMAQVINMRVCLRDTSDFPTFNETFRDFMDGERVTRTCVGGTPHRRGVNVEIDCVAYLG
jgi:2-iminobutanoate/2-iminopropanoate deaminase